MKKVDRIVFVSFCVNMFVQAFSTLERKRLDRLGSGRYCSTRLSGAKTMVLIAEQSGPTGRWHVQPREPLHDFIIRRYSSPILRMPGQFVWYVPLARAIQIDEIAS